MIPGGIRLISLALTGTGVPKAEIKFDSGLNVIFGPSDTGKTFIFQCIDFIFGSKKAPKEIEEASQY